MANRGTDAATGVGSMVEQALTLGRAFLPAKFAFTQVGDLVILSARTVRAAIAPPYPYGEELVGQFLFALRLSWFPLLVSTVALSFGAPGLQAANFLTLIGALDRLGGFFVLAAIRQIAPLVTAVVVAGVAGTAITADLGARKIREELDALQVLGVDPIKNLVVPRVLALMVAPRCSTSSRWSSGSPAASSPSSLQPEPRRLHRDALLQRLDHRSLGLGPDVLDLRRDDRRGLRLQGDERLRRGGGVGRAVNQAVVISFAAIGAINYVFTATLLATNPELQSIR